MPLPLFSGQSSRPSKTHVTVAIAAGKGGVGKSSIAVNLGLALQAQGLQIGIMDADIYGPSIRKMLPEEDPPCQQGSVIQPAICKGIKMISMAYFRRKNEAIAVRAPIANGLISHFINNVEWGNLDILLIDFPPGTGDVQLTLSQQADIIGALMVTTPQEIALLDVRKSISLFEQLKVPIIGIVENMSYYQPSPNDEPIHLFGQGGGLRLASESGAPFLGKIPLDPFLCTCGDRGDSLFAEDPQAKKSITRAFQQLAKQVVEQIHLLKAIKKEGIGSFELTWK